MWTRTCKRMWSRNVTNMEKSTILSFIRLESGICEEMLTSSHFFNQEKQDESDDAEVLVKIFVEFKESISAKKAKNGLDGRFFAGKTISAIIYDQVLFDQQDYSY